MNWKILFCFSTCVPSMLFVSYIYNSDSIYLFFLDIQIFKWIKLGITLQNISENIYVSILFICVNSRVNRKYIPEKLWVYFSFNLIYL